MTSDRGRGHGGGRLTTPLWLPVAAAIGLAVNVLLLLVVALRLPTTATTRALRALLIAGIITNIGDVGYRLAGFHGITNGPWWYAANSFVWVGANAIGYTGPVFGLTAARAHGVLRAPAVRPLLGALAGFFAALALATPFLDPAKPVFMPDPYESVWAVYFLMVLLVSPVALGRVALRPLTMIVGRQAAFLAAGTAFPVAGGILEGVVPILLGPMAKINGIATVLAPVFALMMTYGISRERLFLVEVGREAVVDGSAPSFRAGEVRIFLGDGAEGAALFGNLLRAGRRGIAFSTRSRIDVQRAAGISGSPVLEFHEKPGKDQLDPALIEHREMVPLIVDDYAAEAGSIAVLLDGYATLAGALEKEVRHQLVEALHAAVRRSAGVLLITEGGSGLAPWEVEWLRGLGPGGKGARAGAPGAPEPAAQP